MGRFTKKIGVVLIDIIAINISFLIALVLKYDQLAIQFISTQLKTIIVLGILITAIKLAFFLLFNFYRSLWNYASIYEAVRLTLALVIANTLVVFLVAALPTTIPISVFILTFFIEVLFIGGTRFLYRLLRRITRMTFHEKFENRIMIIGAGRAGSSIVKELELNPSLNSKVVAIIDDDKSKKNMKLHGVPVMGNRYDISRIVKRKDVKEIIIAIPTISNEELNSIYTQCSDTNCKVKILPTISQLVNGGVSMNKVREIELEDLLGREPVRCEIKKMTQYLKDKVILVTGGGGSIGSELCRQIADFSPKQLLILDFYENSTYDIQNELKDKNSELNLKVIIANIREEERIDNVFKKYKPDVVFHAAAHKHVPLMEENPLEAIKNNIFGTLNVVKSADRHKISKFIFISSDKAVNPTNVMGATKRIGEMIIQATTRHSNTKFAAVRFGNVLGSNGSVIPLFKTQIENGGPVTVTHPEVTRFFMTVTEAVQLVILAGSMAQGGEVFVLDMGKPVRIYDLAKNLIRLSGYKPGEDVKIVFTGLRPGEKLYEELLLEEENLTATKHNKIFVAKPIFTDLSLLQKEISILNDLLIKDTEGDSIDYLTHIVPTYSKACE